MSDKKNVRIRLFKDNSRYKGDLFVSVNGVSYKIRRGVEVEVPPEVAEVLEHSQMQDERTAARIAAAARPGCSRAMRSISSRSRRADRAGPSACGQQRYTKAVAQPLLIETQMKRE